MTDRSYVFRLLGDPGSLQDATDQAANAIDALAAKTDAAGARSAAADRSATSARTSLNSATSLLNATTSRGATGFTAYQDSLKGLETAGTSFGAAIGGIAPVLGAANAALATHSKEVTDAGKAVHGFSLETAASKRELLVLAHELSQGNFKRFGSSLLVLGEQTGAAGILFSAAGIGILAVVGALGLFALALAKGAEQQSEFNKSLLLTGNYAGVTEGSFNAMAKSISASTTATVGATRDALQAVVSSGVFGPKLLQPTAEAVTRLEQLTGQSADKIVAEFAKMGDGVAKYAAEHNKSMHLISAAQYEQIKALEDAGKAEEAQGVYLSALNTRLAEHDKSIGTIGRAWASVKKAASDYIQSVEDIGKNDTIDTAIAREQATLARLRAAQNNQGFATLGQTIAAGFSGDFSPQIQKQTELLIQLQESKRFALQTAAATAASDKTQQAGIAGAQVVEKLKQEIDKRAEATKKIQEYTVAVKAMRAANDPTAPNADQEAAMVQAIKDKYKTKDDKAAEKLDTRFTERLEALTAEGLKLDAEAKSFDLYGRSIDKARLAVLNLDIAQGKLKGLDPSRIAQLRTVAAADDQKDKVLDQAKANAEVDKSIAKLREQSEMKQQNARDSEIAQRLAEMETQGVKVGTEAYIENAASIRTWVNIKHDQILARTLAAQQLENDAEVQKLDEETRLLGMSTLERQKATVALKLQTQAQKDIAANPGQTAEILDAMITKQNALTNAIVRNYTATRQFSTGATTAFQKYQEDAGNAGAFGERVIGGGLDKLTDALTEFEKTGKIKLGSLFQFMADEFLKQQARMAVANGSSGALGFLNGIFGRDPTGAGDSVGGIGGSAPDVSNVVYSTGEASGGTAAANSLHPVNERGPELLTQDGKDYLMMGGKGGYVTPLSDRSGAARAGGGSGSSVVLKPVINNYASDVVSASVQQGDDGQLEVMIKKVEDRIGANVLRGRGPVSNGLRARGVPMNNSLARIT